MELLWDHKIGKLIPAQEIENVRTLRMAEVGWGGSGRERERYGRDIECVQREERYNRVFIKTTYDITLDSH